MDDLDTRKHTCARLSKLRALWGDFPVVVRVHSGASEKPSVSAKHTVAWTARSDRCDGRPLRVDLALGRREALGGERLQLGHLRVRVGKRQFDRDEARLQAG